MTAPPAGWHFRHALAGAHHTPEARVRKPNIIDSLLAALRAQGTTETVRRVAALRRAAERRGNRVLLEIFQRWTLETYREARFPDAPEEEQRELWE